MGKTDRLLVKLDELKFSIEGRQFTLVSDAIVEQLKEFEEGRYAKKVRDLRSFYQIENYDIFVSKLDTLMSYLGGVR